MPLLSTLASFRTYMRTQRSTSSQPNTEKLLWRLADVVARMWDMGFTAFGGPPVHFQILHRRFVEGQGYFGAKWIDEQTVSFIYPDQNFRLPRRTAFNNQVMIISIKSSSQSANHYQAQRLRKCSSVSP